MHGLGEFSIGGGRILTYNGGVKSKQKRQKKEPKEERPGFVRSAFSELRQETKDSISAILLMLLGVLFLLAEFELAGAFGRTIYPFLSQLFGKAYLLVPIACLVLGAHLLTSHRRKVVSATAIGGTMFLLSALGLIDLTLGDKTAGYVGWAIAYPLRALFDTWATGLILGVVLIAGILIAFDFSLTRWRESFGGDDEEDATVPQPALAVSAPPMTPVATVPEVHETEEEEMTATPKPAKPRRPRINSDYELPPLSLLEKDKGKPTSGDIKANANIIQRTLAEFGIPVEMGEVSTGPSVTQYTLKPAQGVKIAKIAALQNDLALALAAHPLRMEAPIPGKSLVGLEIPNKAIAFVGLRPLIEDERFQEGGQLVFPLGKDVRGDAVYADIAKMPHLLIAGSTGSGKSVAIHDIIASLLFKNSPDELKFIMIDPKRVELAHYHDIPHLIAPVVTRPKGAIKALRWAVAEMERRYEVLASQRTRDIAGYNAVAEEPLPFIVVVIDELADLMVAHGREVEASIVRIAQMARAVGIHLLLATQRPSVDVITGLIKANITTRMAFAVASQIDSRTILDGMGAEKLLGRGDMLFLGADYSKPKRIQSAFISEKEVRDVTDFIRSQNLSDYAFEESFDEGGPDLGADGGGGGAGEEDPLYQEAYDVVVKSKQASTSFLQRKLRIGYSRAARLIDDLESHGVVGPGEGAKKREVLVVTADNLFNEDEIH